MELIDRYIYAVVKRLPEKQREDITQELRGLIDDMLTQRTGGGRAARADIEAVLTELGDPAALAAKYSEKPRYLIGPELFDKYVMVLKIALAAGAFGMLVAMAVRYAVSPPQSLSEMFGSFTGGILSGLMQAFAWVTAIFAAVEYSSCETPRKLKKENWKPSDLPEIPAGRIVIRRSNPIVGVIFTTFLFVIFNFAPSLFSIYSTGSGISSVPIFDLNVLKNSMPLINAWFAVSFLKQILKLVYGRYDFRFAAMDILLSSICLAFAIPVFSNPQIWNAGLVLLTANNAAFSSNSDSLQWILQIEKAATGAVVFAYLLEVALTVLRTLRSYSTGLPKSSHVGG